MNSLRRKLMLATWTRPTEGNIYGKLDLDCTKMLAYLEYLQEQKNEKCTVTHFVGRAVGEALHRCPSINGYIRFGSYIEHKTVDVSFLVAIDGGKNLGNVKVDNIHQKDIAGVAQALRKDATALRKGEDKEFENSQNTLKMLPSFLIRPVLWLTGWLTSSLGLDLSFLGLKSFPFGACMITSVGMFGLDEGFAPHTPFARVPVIVLIGAVQKKVVVIDDEMAIRPMLTLTATIDHRYIDGAQGATLVKTLREAFDSPWMLDGLNQPPQSYLEHLESSKP